MTSMLLLVVLLLGVQAEPTSISFGTPPPPSPSPASSSSFNGRIIVPLTNFKNTIYVGSLLAGTPRAPSPSPAKSNATTPPPKPQRFSVLFATGSGDTWLPSTACETDTCAQHVRFNGSASSTYTPLHTTSSSTRKGFNLTYGSGSIHGLVARDVLSLVGLDASQRDGGAGGKGKGKGKGKLPRGGGGVLTVKNTSFGEIDWMDERFDTKDRWFPFDGVVGLGYPAASLSKEPPFFDHLMSLGVLKESVFSLYLTQTPGGQGSALVLGGTEPSYHLDEITFYPVVKPYTFWMLQVSSIYLRESTVAARSALDRRKLVTLCANSSCRAVIDSGTSLISGPTAEVERLREFISLKSDCSNVAELPVLTFQFSGHTYSLAPRDYVMKIPMRDSHACFLALSGTDFPAQMGPMWVLGSAFLRKYYTVFDRQRNMIGFAMARPT